MSAERVTVIVRVVETAIIVDIDIVMAIIPGRRKLVVVEQGGLFVVSQEWRMENGMVTTTLLDGA